MISASLSGTRPARSALDMDAQERVQQLGPAHWDVVAFEPVQRRQEHPRLGVVDVPDIHANRLVSQALQGTRTMVPVDDLVLPIVASGCGRTITAG